MIDRRLRWILFAMAFATATGHATAATLLVDAEGLLYGARDVVVEGVPHDVEFVHGRCTDLFSGCNDADDFPFRTEDAARAAAEALLDQVFVDGPLGDFDSNPWLVRGCNPGTIACDARTPWRRHPDHVVSVDLFLALNRDIAAGAPDVIQTLTSSRAFDTYARNTVYAVWSVVPEPGTALLLGLGLVGLAGRAPRTPS